MTSEVQALVSQVNASVAAEASAAGKISALKSEVADLQSKLTTAQASAFSEEDKAAVVKATSDLNASAATLG